MPLYATDWTADVDGAARATVAQVVQAHQDALSACFEGHEGARTEVTFRWQGGKPVGVEANGDETLAGCVEREVAGWRADVRAAGPYTWELASPSAPAATADHDVVYEPEHGVRVHRLGSSAVEDPPPSKRAGQGFLMRSGSRQLSVWVDGAPHETLGDAVLKSGVRECVASSEIGQKVTIAFTPEDGRLGQGVPDEGGTLGDGATRCVVRTLGERPYGGREPVRLEIRVEAPLHIKIDR